MVMSMGVNADGTAPRARASGWYEWFNPNLTQSQLNEFRGPFRVGVVNGPCCDGSQFVGYRCRDRMNRFTDGVSKQLLLGEKHVPAKDRGRCDASGNSGAWDCGMMVPGGNWREQNAARPLTTVNGPISRGPAETGPNPDSYAFGSDHPGVCAFLFADGATQTLSITTLPEIVCRLGDVGDGAVFAMPEMP